MNLDLRSINCIVKGGVAINLDVIFLEFDRVSILMQAPEDEAIYMKLCTYIQ